MWWQLKQSCYYGASPISLSQVLGQWLCSLFTLLSHLNTHLTDAKKPKHYISISKQQHGLSVWLLSTTLRNARALLTIGWEVSLFHWLIHSTSHSPYIKTQWRVLQTSSGSPPFYISDNSTCKYRKCELWLLTRDTSCEGVSIPQLRTYQRNVAKLIKLPPSGQLIICFKSTHSFISHDLSGCFHPVVFEYWTFDAANKPYRNPYQTRSQPRVRAPKQNDYRTLRTCDSLQTCIFLPIFMSTYILLLYIMAET